MSESTPRQRWFEEAAAQSRSSSLDLTTRLARLAGARSAPPVLFRIILYEHTQLGESPRDYEQRMFDVVTPYLADPRIAMVCMEITGHPNRDGQTVHRTLATMGEFFNGQIPAAPPPTAATLLMSAINKRYLRERIPILPAFRPANSYMVTGDDARAISLIKPAAPDLPMPAAAARAAAILDFREGLVAEQLLMQYMPEATTLFPEGAMPDGPIIVAMVYGRRHELFVRLMQELDAPIESVARLGRLVLTPQGWLEDQFRLNNVDHDRSIQIAQQADAFADTMSLVIAADHYEKTNGEQFDVHEQQLLRAELGWFAIRSAQQQLTQPQQADFATLQAALTATPQPAYDSEFVKTFATSTHETATAIYAATMPPAYFSPFAP